MAFTGTPVSSEDRDYPCRVRRLYPRLTCSRPGRWRDGRHLLRIALAKLSLKDVGLERLDDEVDELAEDEEEDQQSRLKSRWAALEKVVGAEPRIRSVAADLVAHFEERNHAQPGKAMIVAMSREICVHLYNEIVALHPEWHDDDADKGMIKVVMTGRHRTNAAATISTRARSKRLEALKIP